MEELFTWQLLATMAGASVATGLFTQLLKSAVKIPTQYLSYIVAVVVLALATIFTAGFNVSALVLCLLNGVVVAGAASNTVAVYQRSKP